MQYYEDHGAGKAQPHDAWRVTLSGTQPELEAMFAKRYSALRKAGAFENQPERLKDRRPVPMAKTVIRYNPPKQAKRKADARPAYDHPGLTEMQRIFRTRYTLGMEVN